MRRIKLTSDEGEFSIDRIEEQIFKNKFDNKNENEMITQFKSEKYYSNVLRKRSQGLKAGIPRESKTVTSPLGNYEKLF